MTIRNKLILAFMVSTITPIVLLCLITGNSIRKDALDKFHQATDTELSRIENTLNIFMNNVRENVTMVAKHPGVVAVDESATSFLNTTSDKTMKDFSSSNSEKKLLAYFANIIGTHKNYLDVYVGTKFGGFIDGDPAATMPPGYDPRTRLWYKGAIQAPDSPALSKAYQSTTKEAVVSISHTISRNGDITGVVAFDIDLQDLTRFISDIHIGETGYIMLIQDDGVVLANPKHPDTEFKNLTEIKMPELAQLGKYSEGSIEIELDDTTYIAQILTTKAIGWKLVGLIQKKEVMSKVYHLLEIMAIVGIILVILFVGAAIFMARSLSKPIIQTTETIQEISRGNLTKRLEIKGKDELGELAKHFNLFIENLQNIIGSLKKDVIVVDNSSAELLSLSNEMDASAKTSSDLAKTVSQATENVNGNMANIAAAMDETTQNTNIVATASEEMSSTINEISRNSDHARQISGQAVEQMRGASEKMQQLGSAAESISAVTDAIAGISDQTNLLALNATIEAARAGQAGKGFAVVANEIKDLAAQTAEATGDIKEKIEGIQATSHETIEEIESANKVMNDINQIIRDIATAIEEQAKAIQEIVSNISQVSQGSQEVNDNIAESSEAIEGVSKDIAQVDLATQDISTNSGHILENLEKLKEMAKGLTNIVNRFTI